MNILIVHAHPEPQSFSAAMKSAALEVFTQQGHAVQVSDLYAMRFNPVASADDFLQRANPDYCVYALEQRHAVATGSLSPDIREELDKLWDPLQNPCRRPASSDERLTLSSFSSIAPLWTSKAFA